MSNKHFFLYAVLVYLPFAPQVCGAAAGNTAKVIPTSIRTLDFRSLPTDALTHSRSKWSRDLFILIDDAAGSPLLYMFDRSGHIQFDAMIQITGASKVRVHDFTAAPDGSVWTCGYATSPAGQRSSFLAHLTSRGEAVQIIRTNPYEARYLAVAPDETVWTVGYSFGHDSEADLTRDSLRHFDASGQLIASAIPTASVGLLRAMNGYLDFSQGRLGWYSPSSGSGPNRSVPEGAYVEISPTDMTTLHSYPATPRNSGDYAWGFALTPSGRVFVKMYHPRGKGYPHELYELDRSANKWVLADGARNQKGEVINLEGNDGESLVFSDIPINKSERKLQIMDLPQTVGR